MWPLIWVFPEAVGGEAGGKKASPGLTAPPEPGSPNPEVVIVLSFFI